MKSSGGLPSLVASAIYSARTRGSYIAFTSIKSSLNFITNSPFDSCQRLIFLSSILNRRTAKLLVLVRTRHGCTWRVILVLTFPSTHFFSISLSLLSKVAMHEFFRRFVYPKIDTIIPVFLAYLILIIIDIRSIWGCARQYIHISKKKFRLTTIYQHNSHL